MIPQIDQWVEHRWHYRRSLASRVTLLTTMAVGVAVAFVALGAYVTARVQMQATLDSSLLDRAHAAADSPVLNEVSQVVPSEALGAGDIRLAFLQPDGDVRSLDRGPKLRLGQPELDVAQGGSPEAVRTIVAGSTRYRVVTVPNDQGALVLAQSLEPQDKVLATLGLVMLLFGAAGVLAAGLAGWAVARNGLRPVRRLSDAVEQIARTEDLRPLKVEGDDEIARLATAFNSMLRALEASRDRQRQLVADAGHELRTPLTSLRTNLDLLSQADSGDGNSALPPAARAELLDDVSAQIAELSALIGDLIELARDEPVVVGVVEPVDLSEVVERALSRVRLRAPSVNYAVTIEPWELNGEAAALERAVTNLLDNAAKWTPVGATVTVRLVDGTLTVSDEGPGIAEEDLPHVFDRFYRSVSSRSMPGSGLGLSIVRQVVERHGGTVSARTGPRGGALFTVTLPTGA